MNRIPAATDSNGELTARAPRDEGKPMAWCHGGRRAARARGPRRRWLLGLLALILVVGCRSGAPRPGPAGTRAPRRLETPVGPLAPPTETRTSALTAHPLPTPTSTPLPVAADDLNILLLGTDRRINRGTGAPWRTDTLIVVAVRPRAGKVAMLSIPRDLWVTIPGYGEQRINVADYLGERDNGSGGGPALVAATLQQNLGIPVSGYARIHFEGLERIIDTLGGISITSDRAFDEWMDDSSGKRLVHVQVIAGTQRMDGQTALGYARSRSATNDLDRSRRQQQILLAVRDAALRPEILPRLPALLSALSDAVDTDLGAGRVLSLVGLALRLGPGSYRGLVMDETMVRDWVTPGGAMVLLPNRASIEQAWAELTAP